MLDAPITLHADLVQAHWSCAAFAAVISATPANAHAAVAVLGFYTQPCRGLRLPTGTHIEGCDYS